MGMSTMGVSVQEVKCTVSRARRLHDEVILRQLDGHSYKIDVDYKVAVVGDSSTKEEQMSKLKSLTGASSNQATILQESFKANLSAEIVKKKTQLPEVYQEVVVDKKLAAVKV